MVGQQVDGLAHPGGPGPRPPLPAVWLLPSTLNELITKSATGGGSSFFFSGFFSGGGFCSNVTGGSTCHGGGSSTGGLSGSTGGLSGTDPSGARGALSSAARARSVASRGSGPAPECGEKTTPRDTTSPVTSNEVTARLRRLGRRLTDQHYPGARPRNAVPDMVQTTVGPPGTAARGGVVF